MITNYKSKNIKQKSNFKKKNLKSTQYKIATYFNIQYKIS
jgi:hypothetical protein